MERRVFVKKACGICLLGMAGMLTPGLMNTAIAKGNKIYKVKLTEQNEVIVPLSLFIENKLQIVRVKDWEYDMAIQKKEDGSFIALLLRCTHMDNQIHPSNEGYICSLHGSTFDQTGNVTKGPAEIALTQYHANIKEDHLIITA
jgi:Rieske Fe-S protein